MNKFDLRDLLDVACCQYHEDLCKNVYDYITNLQQENKNQAKRNSRQRLANKKQQELILKLQQEIEKLNEDKRGMLVQLYKENVTKDIIQEEYEKIIFEYLAENCSEFDDEHMQHLADLKVEQYIKLQQENEKLILNYKSQKDINQKLLSMDIKHNRELKNYKSKVDNALKIIEKEKELMGYAKYDSCLLLIENTLKNVSEKNDTNNIDNVYKAFGLKG